ncbi:MAG TPA: glycoside hydrolase family 3 C-terminal domain-containing protein [Candidatus Limnocylindrales bacterium]
MSDSGSASDYDKAVEAAVERGLAGLDLETKVLLLTGINFWATYAVPQIGLRSVVVSDGPAGVKGGSFVHDEKTTSLPSPTSLAATWDEGLIREIGRMLAGEARRKGVDVLLGPTINLHRSPVGGRHFEQFSEDPLLTGRIASAYVSGLQSRGVGGCPKHYVCNDSETERQSYKVDVAERPLRELYMAPFERTVVEANAWTVMAAYSGVRGTPMTENDLLTDPLKTTWGFDGLVMSDWFATHETVAAGRAALDLVMPGPDGPWGDALLAAVRAGEVSEAAIDDKVRRLLRLAARVGALEGVAPSAPLATPAPQAEVSALVRRTSAAGSVLLANDGILPLAAGDLRRLAVMGPNAALPPSQGGGSSNLRPDYSVTAIDGLRAALPGVEILARHVDRYRSGFQRIGADEVTLPPSAGTDASKPGILVRFMDEAAPGTDAPSLADAVLSESRREIRPDGRLHWGGDPRTSGRHVFDFSTTVTSPETGLHRIGLGVRGHVAIWVDGRLEYAGGEIPETDDIDAMWNDAPNQVAEVEMTAGRPAEIVIRWRKFYDQNIVLIDFMIEKPVVALETQLAEAERLAGEADAVVLMIGTTGADESESFDRTHLSLQTAQDELVRRVAAVNPRTVVVVAAGSPVLMPWRDSVSAILLTWFPGQEAGNALADMLLGAVEPGGRMPTTWPAELADVPILDTKPTDGWLHYTEGLEMGYRAWLLTEVAPAFPFGHGLGYTSWTYIDAEATSVSGLPGVRVHVRNSGGRAGREVVQLYLARLDSAVERPLLWLGGYATIEADAGETAEVVVPVDIWALRHWDEADGDWAIEPGRFEVRIGRSLGDLRLAAAIELES